MEEIRCKACNRKLGEMDFEFTRQVTLEGAKEEVVNKRLTLRIKCPRCGEMNVRKENVRDGSNCSSERI